MRTRRRFLQACAALPVAALAGCSGDEGTTTRTGSSPTETVTASPTLTRSPTATATESTSEYTPPAYVEPGSYTERTLSLTATEDCELGATLAVPDGNGPFPGVVIVHGSGGHDRNGTIGPVQPYRDLAVGLASAGIAVLRYDKRTYACSFAIDATELTVDDEVTDDALTAIDRLREVDRVDADSIVVAGHSLGAMLAPRIAQRDTDLAGIAMLAAPARSLPEIIVSQTRYQFERDGNLTEAERERLDRIETIADRVQAGNVSENEVIWGGSRPYWRSLADYDQVATAAELDMPILLQQGLRDKQVPPDTELSRWREALGNSENVTIQTYDGLNHLFVDGAGLLETGGNPDPGHVGNAVVRDLADWTGNVTD